MKRRWFWLFGAPAAAQVIYPVGVTTEEVPPPERRKPKNGECPVCRTMADPWVPTVESYFPAGTCVSRGMGNVVNSACFYPTKEDIPKSRTVICSNCRVHYEQDRAK